MKQDYSIKLVANPAKDGDVIIQIRIILDRQKTEFSSGVRGAEMDWKDSGTFSERTNFNKNLNVQLEEIIDRVADCYRNLIQRKVRPTAKILRNEFLGKKDVRHSPTLIDYVDAHIEKLRHLPEEEFKTSSLIHYTALRTRLTSFLKSIEEEKLLLQDLSRKHVLEFMDFLRIQRHPTLPKTLAKSTVGKYLSKLRTIVRDARRKGMHKDADPFDSVKVDRSPGNTPYLNHDEIKILKEIDLSHNPSLDKVRLVFLFSVFTGLRFSDAINLKKSNIKQESDGHYRMLITQRKTGRELYRPMFRDAIELYLKLNDLHPDIETILPKISNQKVNAYLKVIADLTGFEKALTHRVARRTFAVQLLESGASLHMTGHFLGHASIKTTEQAYAAISRGLENRVVDEVDRLSAKVLRKVS